MLANFLLVSLLGCTFSDKLANRRSRYSARSFFVSTCVMYMSIYVCVVSMCVFAFARVHDLINFESQWASSNLRTIALKGTFIDFLRNSRAIHCAFSSFLLSGQRRLHSMHNISNIDRCARSGMHAYPKEVPRKPLYVHL